MQKFNLQLWEGSLSSPAAIQLLAVAWLASLGFDLFFATIASKQKGVTDPRQTSIGNVMDLIRDIVKCIDNISAGLTTHEQCVQC